MMERAIGSQVRRFLSVGAVAAGACCQFLMAQAQESAEQVPAIEETIEEIIVVVNRAGKPVDSVALRLEEIRLKIIREFELEQTVMDEELWRLKLRSALKRNASQIARGYDAQRDAARVRYSQANHLPIDRVRPATVISIRF
jgi:hypothetical protein